MVNSLYRALIMIALGSLMGCAGSKQELKIDPQVQLTVRFRDAGWDGLEIPVAGRCGDCGGGGRSPALRIGGLPVEANEVVVEFNDLRIPDLAENGGHGTLAVATGGKSEVVLPSVREETMSLPHGVRSVRKHRCVFWGHKGGAYKAPCGCGQGNEYVATVLAIRRNGDSSVVLAQTEIALGLF